MVVMRGCSTPNVVLYMENFKPVQSTSLSDEMVVLIPKSMHNFFMNWLIVIFFKDTLCSQNSDLNANPPVYRPKAYKRPTILCNKI